MARLTSPEIAERNRLIKIDVSVLKFLGRTQAEAYEILAKELGLCVGSIRQIHKSKDVVIGGQKRHAQRVMPKEKPLLRSVAYKKLRNL